MNLGMPEMIFIFLLALLLFGPKKLPQIGRELGKALNEFKRASNEFKSQLETEIQQVEAAERAKSNSELAGETASMSVEAARPASQALPGENIEPQILPPSEPTIARSFGQSKEAEPHTPELPASKAASDSNRPASSLVAAQDERAGADHYSPLRESNA